MNEFDFSKEMVYGKKHVNQLNYDNSKYDFRPFLRECFNINNLNDVHVNNPKYVIYTAVEYPKKEVGTKQRMTGARVNAPLVKEIIIDIIRLFDISKDKNKELLKVDTNFLYRKLNATV